MDSRRAGAGVQGSGPPCGAAQPLDKNETKDNVKGTKPGPLYHSERDMTFH